jgi:hypothetical protein
MTQPATYMLIAESQQASDNRYRAELYRALEDWKNQLEEK